MTTEDYEAHKEDYKNHNISSGAFVLIQDVYIRILEEQLNAKDEEIEKLKKERNHFHDKYIEVGQSILDWATDKKARSIVAMLFWEWRKAKENYNALYQYDKGIVEGMRYSFQKAYEMIKDNS